VGPQRDNFPGSPGVLYAVVKEPPTVESAPPVGGGLRVAFEQHAPALLRFALLLAGRRETAEDIVQESFIRLAPKLDGLDPDAVWPYLRRVAINIWKNRLRRLSVEARFRSRSGASAVSQPAANVEDRDRVWRAVSGLPMLQRACVVLRYYEDLSERETASVLGCSVGTVKSQTSRALLKLDEVLRDED
jgi:RNA polymerase sigma-70 factor (sigma-E family)